MTTNINIDELTGPIWWPAHPEVYKGEVKVGDIVTIASVVVDKWGNPVPLEKRNGSQTHMRELQDVRVIELREDGHRRYLIAERRSPEHVRNVRPVGGMETIHIDHTQVLKVKGATA